MGFELNMDNLLSEEDINDIFGGYEEPEKENEESIENAEESITVDNQEEINITDAGLEEIFSQQESVGNEEDIEEEKNTPSKKKGTSPNNIYSSIANALKEEGIFPDLDDETCSNANDAAGFRDLVEKQINAGLEERQKVIYEALNAGVQVSDVQKYEQMIQYLNSIGEEAINDESENGETLRKNLIYQDFINRGYSQERAIREVEKSFKSGSDIEDAFDALKGNREFYQGNYNNLIENARKRRKEYEDLQKKNAADLKKSIMEGNSIFDDVRIDKSTRQKIVDNIFKPTYKDPKSGSYMTNIQKYQLENPQEFLKNVGIIYTITDGFKNIDKIVSGKVNKEVKKGLKKLESTLANSTDAFDNNLTFIGNKDYEDSPFARFTLQDK